MMSPQLQLCLFIFLTIAFQEVLSAHSEGGEGSEAHDNCVLPPEPGVCKANMPRYYYDPHTHRCEQFIYGGCRGNANRFLSRQDCMQKCQDVTTS